MTTGMQSIAREPLTASSTPSQLTRLFNRLHADGIVYCHWKCNEHLRTSMTGAADIHLLVDRRATLVLERVVAATGFKRLTSVPWSHPAIETYLGFDADSGTLFQLNVQFELTLGERYLEGYRLPWEKLLLSTRQWDEASRIYVADPHLELLLLAVRVALKLRLRDVVLDWLGRAFVRRGPLREFRWLAGHIAPDRLRSLGGSLVGARAVELLLAMVEAGMPTLPQLLAFRRSIQPPLTTYRTHGAVDALRQRWAREWGPRWARVARRLGFLVPTRRVLPHGGVVVAFVGADGSGKSTVTESLTRWLATYVDAERVYFGNGKGAISLPRQLLEFGAALVRRASAGQAGAGAAVATGRTHRGAGTSLVRDWGDLAWVAALTRERLSRVRRARRARYLGMVVICDRFPQTQLPGLNDGPWLGHWLRHGSAVRRAVARRELAAIRSAEQHAPDLVVKLHVPLDTAQARRPHTPPEQLAQKAQQIRALRYPGAERIVDIDASQPLEGVLLDVKRAVWECL